MKDKSGNEELGLSTNDALTKLRDGIEQVLQQYQFSQRHRKSNVWIRDTLHHSSQHSTINWISVACIGSVILLLAASSVYNEPYSLWLMLQAVIVCVLLGIGLATELWDNKLRHDEIPRKVQSLIAKIKDESHRIHWLPEHYPNLLLPYSPCITLQWTYRDRRLVNLPWALLVKDDIVVIRPGQVSPGYCESMEKSTDYPLLHAKEVYGPPLQNANEFFSSPKLRHPLENKKYKMLDTPYLNNLRISLEHAWDRPVTQHNQQRHYLMVKIIERLIVPCSLILYLLVASIKYLFVENYMETRSGLELFVLAPIATIVPLLPLVFPVMWNFMNYFGMARFQTLFEATSNSHLEQTLFDERDSVQVDRSNLKFERRQVFSNFLNIVQGTDTIMARSANIVHVLGSLTALCCVDKKGILSWPNPTAEKIFFLHNEGSTSNSSSLSNVDLSTDVDSIKDKGSVADNESPAARGEVLDLTHDFNDTFKLHFDDTGWKRFLNNLKPLGLAILLNTCNVDTQERYTQFCSHITCEAMYNENLIPVTNRRCLCELAKEIGFVDEAQKIFVLEQQLSAYRHLQNEMARRDNKYARALHTKLKFPFPHMFAVIVKELSTGAKQLLSQGTADIILDSCVDYWDGQDLCPLSFTDRKKIQDFYQRSSLTAYCTAFAYRPLTQSVSKKLAKFYLELPNDSRRLYLCRTSPTPASCESRNVLEPRIRSSLSHFYSTDSLLYNDSPTTEISDVDSYFDVQCNQVFIGMVTMQYQAQLDMVHLIEQLERACIRFVHFSEENELRSRVFSEKMGLESGWNCHISLLSEKNSNLDSNKALSYSAPGAINLEHSVLNFTEQKRPSQEDNTVYNSQQSINVHAVESHDWQSLSCLTDSTEQSAPINFDMSNRAKLPRGIEKIRPHIENIDNVPLLVSLFTDCTASSTKEMIHIMQDYGEVICVLGSSANYENAGIFMQADASISVEPLYPQVCQKNPALKPVQSGSVSPVELARTLSSVACSLSILREDHLSIYGLVLEARHFMHLFWNAVQFWLCCSLTLTVLQLCVSLTLLPPIFTAAQVLWICCTIVPLLSVSLMGTATDPEIMKQPQGKKQFNLQALALVLWTYGAKFLPVILLVTFSYAAVLSSYCHDLCAIHMCTCAWFHVPSVANSTLESVVLEGEHELAIANARNFALIIIVFHFVSIAFVHRNNNVWTRSPLNNFLWQSIVIILLFLQTAYTLAGVSFSDKSSHTTVTLKIPNSVLAFAIASPAITFLVNESVKREEIKMNLRYQKRARLDFGTKLGMNSPF